MTRALTVVLMFAWFLVLLALLFPPPPPPTPAFKAFRDECERGGGFVGQVGEQWVCFVHTRREGEA